MAAQVVYNEVAEGVNLDGQLFQGKSFWVAQRVPLRSHFIQQIKSNGGRIVPLEKQADILIADDLHKSAPVGSTSYKFIEASLKKGEMEDPEKYPAGPPVGTVREVGSLRPGKSTRTPFTAEDDRVLRDWVRECERSGGGVAGNEIYKLLEKKNDRHTWQSWRDRYVKYMRGRETSPVVSANAPPSPPSDHSHAARSKVGPAGQPRESKTSIQSRQMPPTPDWETLFDESDFEELYANVDMILSCPVKEYRSGWETWSTNTPHTAQLWQKYFEEVVQPRWEKDSEEQRQKVKEKVSDRHKKEDDSAPSPSREQSAAATHDSADHAQLVSSDKISRPPPPDTTDAAVGAEAPEAGHSERAAVIAHERSVQKSTKRTYDSLVSPKDDESFQSLSKRSRQSDDRQRHPTNPQRGDYQKQPEPFRNDLTFSSSPDEHVQDRNAQTDRQKGYQSDTKHQGDESPLSARGHSTTTTDSRRPRVTAFDTQAILSSPIGDLDLAPLPALESQLPEDHPEDDTSDNSSIASSEYGDPDPPLRNSETDEFYQEKYAEGYTDDDITRALDRTTCRPRLATLVLEHWKAKEPLPNQRGVWSEEDDQYVHSSNANELSTLARKHTWDEWGGILERIKYLDSTRG